MHYNLKEWESFQVIGATFEQYGMGEASWLRVSCSGGGSVNIFSKNDCDMTNFNFSVSGGFEDATYKLGGNGTYSCGIIGSGYYVQK